MATLLALDTSTDACSVALQHKGEVLEDFRVIPRQHTKQLLPMVEEIFAQAGIAPTQLDAIAFGRGPGSFAGLRIATGVAQGLAFATERPVLPISTLEAMALLMMQQGQSRVAASLDARMNEVYWACYEQREGLPVALSPERVCPPTSVELPDQGQWYGCGAGFRYLIDMPSLVQQGILGCDDGIYPAARQMLTLAEAAFARGEGVEAELAQPVYLRDETGWKKKDQQ